jgi:hypothetical protein
VVAVEQCDEDFFAALGSRSAGFAHALRVLRDAHA